jgi:hypothetical protein
MALLSYTQFLNEKLHFNTSWIFEKLLNEGGAYGHLNHPFEDMELTMGDFKEMILATVHGLFTPENFITEKCLSGDSLVTLEKNGIVQIKELVEKKYEDKILSIDTDGQVTYLKILDWVDNGITEDWLLIETEDGNKIQVTPNHRIFVDGIDVKAEDLKIGDFLTVL